MPNRKERRRRIALARHGIRAARLRCVACDSVGKRMTNEHFWPLWLIEHAQVRHEGIAWADKKNAPPKSAKIPMCADCNHRLGAELEEPVKQVLADAEAGVGIGDMGAELLVRWLWKFEGLVSTFAHLDQPEWRYSDRWTLIDRVLGTPVQEIREHLVLAIGLTYRNDDDRRDWPMGLDSGVSDEDGIFVSGVFGRTALMVSLVEFENFIPGCFGRYRLAASPLDDNSPCFFPPVCFPRSLDAIFVTRTASLALKQAHEKRAKAMSAAAPFTVVKPRLDIPNL